ncbi:GIN domain-containing protein [Hyphobacterium sp.]|uniref:GIN domain-containing protein n=1 Tax=Hyphobacterium sp. TaxID=2004662 RepID=UPI003BAAA30B
MAKSLIGALFVAGISASAVFAQSAQSTEERQIDRFNHLEMSGRFDVIFTPSDTPRLVMQGDPEDIRDIDISLRNGRLEIEQDRGVRRWFGRARDLDVVVFVEGPGVEEFDASRGMDAQINDLTLTNLDMDVSTGASVRVSGNCESGSFNVSTGASLNGRELDCGYVRANASTGASMRVNATDELHANVSTGADVYSMTSPDVFRSNTSTGGNVRIGDRN